MANVISKPFESNIMTQGRVRNASAGRLDRLVFLYTAKDIVKTTGEPSRTYSLDSKARAGIINYRNPEEGVEDFELESRTDMTIRTRYRANRDQLEALTMDGQKYKIIDWHEDLSGARRRYMFLHLKRDKNLELL